NLRPHDHSGRNRPYFAVSHHQFSGGPECRYCRRGSGTGGHQLHPASLHGYALVPHRGAGRDRRRARVPRGRIHRQIVAVSAASRDTARAQSSGSTLRGGASVRYHKELHRMLRFETAGESHGECLVATLTGLPAGIPISLDYLNRQLWRRQQGYGRGGRMKIETDRVHIVSGVRSSQTIGSPIAILLENKDWKNWTDILPVEEKDLNTEKAKPVSRPRPGHADLAGALKYNFADARYILERASARETTARVALGGLAKTFLRQFDIEVLSHVIGVGSVRLQRPAEWGEIVALSERDTVLLGCVDAETEQRMKEVVDHAYRTGDTSGGIFEVVAHGLPPGLGSHATWDSRLDGRLAQAIVSIQAVKGAEIGH